MATEILLDRTNFFELATDENDKSLLRSFLNQPNLDLKDILGMMVDILMAAIDTVSFTFYLASDSIKRTVGLGAD